MKHNLPLTLILSFLFFISSQSSASVIELEPTTSKLSLNTSVELYEDITALRNISQVRKQDNIFKKNSEEQLKLKVNRSNYWIHFSLQNNCDKATTWYLGQATSMIDEIDFYAFSGEKLLKEHIGGSTYPFNKRDVLTKNFVYSIYIEAKEKIDVYLRIKSSVPTQLALEISNEGKFIENSTKEYYIQGLFYGLLGIIIFYNTILLLSLRDSIYLSYILFTLSFLLIHFQLSGFSDQILFRDSPNANPAFIPFLIGAICLSISWFCKKFLDTKKTSKVSNNILWLVIIASVAQMVSVSVAYFPYHFNTTLGYILVIILWFLCLPITINAHKKGVYYARYFALAWMLFSCGSILHLLFINGLIEKSFLGEHGLQTCYVFGILLLSAALADRLNLIRREKEASDEHAMYVQVKATELLEQSVQERTAELEKANKFISRAKKSTDSLNRQLEQEAERNRKLVYESEAANESKSRFLATVSHEIRTPLNGILGYAQILKKDSVLNSRQKDGIDIIHKSGEHLLTLINDILNISKIEAGKMQLESSPFHLQNFIDTLSNIISIRAEQKGINYLMEKWNFKNNKAADELPEGIVADESRLRQILINLLGNALKFTDHGTVRLRIGYVLTLPNPKLCKLRFEVTDSGVGIEPEQIKRIFDAFHQSGDTTKQNQGTGLGLSISNKLIKMMGGQIYVDSKPNEGSRFWFDLSFPLATDIAPQETVQKKVISGYEGDKRTILVADDGHENILILRNLLEPIGFELLIARNGEEAYTIAFNKQPDFILSDLVMPIMDGFAFLEMLQTNPILSKIPVIVISACASDEDQEKCIEMGAKTFISKPIDQDLLLEKIAEHCDITWIEETKAQEVPVAKMTDEVKTEVKEKSFEDELKNEKLVTFLNDILNLSIQGDVVEIQKLCESWFDKQFAENDCILHIERFAKEFNDIAINQFIKSLLEPKKAEKTAPEKGKLKL